MRGRTDDAKDEFGDIEKRLCFGWWGIYRAATFCPEVVNNSDEAVHSHLQSYGK